MRASSSLGDSERRSVQLLITEYEASTRGETRARKVVVAVVSGLRSPDPFAADGFTVSVVLSGSKGQWAGVPQPKPPSRQFAGGIHRSAADLARANPSRCPIVIRKHCLGEMSLQMAIPFAAYQQVPWLL